MCIRDRGETDTERVQARRDRHLCVVRERGCRSGEIDTERVQPRRDRHYLCVVRERGYRSGETDTERVQARRDRHREGAGEERQTFVCCQGGRVQVWRDRH